MSLHNSELENQLLDFSKLETDQEGLWRALDLGTNLKPSEAGSNLRGGTAKRSGVFARSRRLEAETERSEC